MRDCMTARWRRGRGERGASPSPARKALVPFKVQEKQGAKSEERGEGNALRWEGGWI